MTKTRDRFITATNELFRRYGYNGTSLKQVTEAAAAPVGSLYHFFPGGKAELTEAVIEETGLVVEVEELIDVYFFADDPRGNGILIVYKCKSVGGELTASAEGDNPTYFEGRDIPGKLAGGGHDQAILTWNRDNLTIGLQCFVC